MESNMTTLEYLKQDTCFTWVLLTLMLTIFLISGFGVCMGASFLHDNYAKIRQLQSTPDSLKK